MLTLLDKGEGRLYGAKRRNQYWGGKMAETQIKSMSITPEAILDWLLLNPRESQGDCAAFFGVTESWLSVIVNSDCFQARLLERRMTRDESFRSPSKPKCSRLSTLGLDRIGEKLKFEPTSKTFCPLPISLLGRLGYGPKQGPAVGGSVNVQTNFVISTDWNFVEQRLTCPSPLRPSRLAGAKRNRSANGTG